MSLTQQELTRFHRQGFLLKPGLFEAEDLEPLRTALTEIIDRQARALLADGQLTQLYEEEPFGKRLARIHAENPEAGEQINHRIIGKGGGGYNGPAMLHCIRHPACFPVSRAWSGRTSSAHPYAASGPSCRAGAGAKCHGARTPAIPWPTATAISS